MGRGILGSRLVASLALACAALLTACAPAAAPEPTKAGSPVAQATKPVAPTAAPTKAAEQAKPAGQAVLQLRAGSSDGKGSPYSNVQDKFAELVSQKSNGQIKVQVFYQSLGAEQQLTESVMAGSVDFGMVSMGNAGRFSDAFLVYDLPFLFKTNEALLQHLDGAVGQQAIARFEKDTGLKVLVPMTPGSGRDVQTRGKLAKTPADLKGMKIRVVSSPVDLGVFQGWGANPTPLDWGQLYTALQQGVVDGCGVPISNFVSTKLHEVAKYSTHVDYQFLVNVFHMSAKKFAAMTPEQQKIIVEAAKEATMWNRKDAAETVRASIDEMKKSGGTVYEPTPEEYAQWTGVRDRVWQDVGEKLKGRLDLELAKKILDSQGR